MKTLTAFVLLSMGAVCIDARSAHALTEQQIRAQSARSVIHITVKSHEKKEGAAQDIKTGSGFVISEKGYALTSNHLFPDQRTAIIESIEVSTEAEPLRRQLADIVHLEPDDDLALLKIRGNDRWPALCVGDSNATPIEAWLYALGYTSSREPVLTSRAGRLTNIAGKKWQTDLALNHGNSGGPVFDAQGHVVAVIAEGLEGEQLMSFVVPVMAGYGLIQRASARTCAMAAPAAAARRPEPAPSSPAVGGDEGGPIIVPPGGRQRFSLVVGGAAELTDKSLVLAVREPDLKRNSAAVKFAGRSMRLGVGQGIDLSLYGAGKCWLSVVGVRAEAIDFLIKCQ